jgi:antitoxin (DNA-binding transcriptional repressor) of toxin-antitoxin stability system
VYCGDLERCFLLPISLVAGRYAIQLRLTPARNGQRACINLADDFTFEGAVAQLARALPWHGRGQGFESPQLHSSEDAPLAVGSDDFRDHLGYWSERAEQGDHLLVTYRGRPRFKVIPVNPHPAPLWPLPATARHAAYPPSFAASSAAGASSDRSDASVTALSASSAASAPPMLSSRNASASTT